MTHIVSGKPTEVVYAQDRMFIHFLASISKKTTYLTNSGGAGLGHTKQSLHDMSDKAQVVKGASKSCRQWVRRTMVRMDASSTTW